MLIHWILWIFKSQ